MSTAILDTEWPRVSRRHDMKRTVMILGTILISLLIVVVAGVGCASDSREVTKVMDRVPWDTNPLVVTDIVALRGDGDLGGLYTAWKDACQHEMETHGIDSSDVSLSASGGGLGLYEGDFDLVEVRYELEDRDYSEYEYKDMEVWQKPHGNEWVALMDGLIVIGSKESVQDCLTVIKEDAGSLSDRQDATDVMARLPDGVIMRIGAVEPLTLLGIFDLEAWGMSVNKKDGQTIEIVAVYKYDDEDAAHDSVDGLEDILDLVYRNVNVSRDGIYLTAEADQDIDDFNWSDF
jgi:hypothetical protein